MSATTVDRRPLFSLGSGTVATRLGLQIADGVTYEEWEAALRRTLGFAEASLWWVGDLLAYGEWRYGEKYKATLELLDLKYDYARDLAYVAGNVPEAVRRADLSWRHHRDVAKLVPAEQEQWLARAAAEGMSHRELLAAIAAERAEPAARAAVLEQLRVTVDPERLERYEAAAAARYVPLNEWAIAVLDEAAGVKIGLSTSTPIERS